MVLVDIIRSKTVKRLLEPTTVGIVSALTDYKGDYMKISRRERKIILKHLNDLNDSDGKHSLPKEYHGYNGVTQIRYGYMQRKMISTEKIEQVAKEVGAKHW